MTTAINKFCERWNSDKSFFSERWREGHYSVNQEKRNTYINFCESRKK